MNPCLRPGFRLSSMEPWRSPSLSINRSLRDGPYAVTLGALQLQSELLGRMVCAGLFQCRQGEPKQSHRPLDWAERE